MKDLLATIYFKEFPWSSLLDVVLNCTPSVYPNNTKRLNFIRPQILDQKKKAETNELHTEKHSYETRI